MLYDLVPGKDSDAERIAASSNASEDFGGISIKPIETVLLGRLHALVAKKTYDAVKGSYPMVAEGGEEGPWVIRVPDELTAGLAALDAAKQKKIAAEWAKAEEFARDKRKPAFVSEMLSGICELARTTKKAKKSLFLWMTL
jgi:hypothetical protein